MPEFQLYQALKDLSNSESLRYEQSLQRGSSVRPMDVPGPLGEVEAAVFEIFKAEQKRASEKAKSNSVRPLRPEGCLDPRALGRRGTRSNSSFSAPLGRRTGSIAGHSQNSTRQPTNGNKPRLHSRRNGSSHCGHTASTSTPRKCMGASL
jgi:hypothetical protein